MLYVSTRSRTDSYTAHRALHEERAPDGGLYIPFQLRRFTPEEIRQFKQRSFSENVAYILNVFFSCKFNSWDVEFCCGRNPMKHIQMPHKLSIVETWHNTASTYAYMEQELFSMLTGTNHAVAPAYGWARIAIRIAILFAIYGEAVICGNGIATDVTVDTDMFLSPVAAWYARQMGLPIGKILCGTLTHGNVWDLLQTGTMNTVIQNSEMIGIERLIYFTLGTDEVLRYVSCRSKQQAYHLDDERCSMLNAGCFAAVISEERQSAMIGSFYRSHGYVLDMPAAISFSALQDYRAHTGESKQTLLLSLANPLKNVRDIQHLLGITAAELESAVTK